MWWTKETVSVGLSGSAFASNFLKRHPGKIDFIEVAFEQFSADFDVVGLYPHIPLLLHSASLGISQERPATQETRWAVESVAAQIRSPWVGDHVSYVAAEPILEVDRSDPYIVGYTVAPQMNEATLAGACENVRAARQVLTVPLILENPPVYFTVPGSTYSQAEFISRICNSENAGLLLDLTHLSITCHNLGLDIQSQLDALPLDRLLEVHISGLTKHGGLHWDDHAMPAPPSVFESLGYVFDKASPNAVTLEYNWQTNFPEELLISQVEHIRRLANACS